MSELIRTSATPMLPARAPDGWWMSHPRYRTYVLFSMTGLVLAAVNVLLLFAVSALASGIDAWRGFLGAMGSPPGLLLGVVLLVGTLFFAVRFARVGAKPLSVRLGPVPAIHTTVILIAQVGGLVTGTLVLLVLLSGAIGI